MTSVHLAFKAFDSHELLCHFVARRSGAYAARGLQVSLIDSTFVSDSDLPPRTFHAACGAALLNYVMGVPFKVILADTDYPMFWLYGTRGFDKISDLAGSRVASYPPVAPPAVFLKTATADVDLQLLPVSTDNSRLGLLRSGDVDAALISSAYPPAVMAGYGYTNPLLLGDAFRAVSTGLAVSPALLREEPELAILMVASHLRALEVIRVDDERTDRRSWTSSRRRRRNGTADSEIVYPRRSFR
jgi:hypothetical protein